MALHNPSIRIEVVDKDPRRIRRWNSAHLPLHESGLVDVVRVSRDGACHSQRTTQSATEMATDSESEKEEDSERVPNLFFTCDTQAGIARADLIMLAVNTPTKTFGVGAGRATNMGTFDAAIREVAQYARPGAIIVEKSTVPCGTAQRVRKVVRLEPLNSTPIYHSNFYSLQQLGSWMLYALVSLLRYCRIPNFCPRGPP